MRLARPRQLILLALLLSVGIGALFVHAISTMRQDQWNFASRTNANLAHTLALTLRHTLESFQDSLKDVVTLVQNKQVMALAPALRDQALFHQILSVPHIEGVLVLDLAGQVRMAAGPVALAPNAPLGFEPLGLLRQGKEFRGMQVGKPIKSPFSQAYVLPLGHSYQDAEGRIAGMVVGLIQLDYFSQILASVDLGRDSGLTLLLLDGTVVVRFPYSGQHTGKSVAGTANMRKLQAAPKGTFSGRAVLDDVMRMYAFEWIERYPLVVNIAQSVDVVLADWRRSATWLGIFALVLMAACIGLAVLFAQELERSQLVGNQLEQTRHDLRTILDNLPSLVSYWDRDLENRFANRATEFWFGISPEQLRGMPAATLLGPRDYAAVQPYLERALQGHAQCFERNIKNAQGQRHHVHVTYTPDWDNGQVRGVLAQLIDISGRKQMEDELFEEKERIRLTLQSIGDAVICTDAQGLVTYLNPVAERMTGWQKTDAAQQDVDRVVPLYLSNGRQPPLSPLRHALATRLLYGPTRSMVLHCKEGQRYEVEESASPIIDRHGQLTGAVMVLHDVTETVALTARMAHLAQYDALTDLPNRLLLHDRARHALAQARRDGRLLAVVYLDLDGFKAVNDCLGHDAGDQLLVEFARRLKGTVRESDTVCRQGGDEFVLLLPGLDDVAHLEVLAHKILSTCEAAFQFQGACLGKSGCIGVSGGVALFPKHGASFDALSRHADEAMYAAKRAGRGCFYLYQGDAQPPTPITPMPPASA